MLCKRKYGPSLEILPLQHWPVWHHIYNTPPRVHLLGDILGAGRGVALWLECGCAVSINAPLMMTCNAMQARQKTRSELHASLQPLDHSRTNVNVILVYNSINDLVTALWNHFCCRILRIAVKSWQVELWKRLMVLRGEVSGDFLILWEGQACRLRVLL